VRAAAFALVLCAACASYRLLPLPAEAGPMPVRYERTRLFFHSVEEDGALSRVFAGPGAVLATVAQPQRGVFASSDGGASWAFSPGPAFDGVLFGDRTIFAVAGSRVLHSEDAGRTWEGAAPGEDAVEALALGPGGALYAGGRGRLYVSADSGRTFRALSPQLPSKNWRARSIVAVQGALYLAVRGDPPEPRRPSERFAELLGYASGEAVAAVALADLRDPSPRTVEWGAPGDGVYVSRDGGATFARTGLKLDAWLAVRERVLYAVAADPMLQAAALMRRHPDLAGAADRHLQGDRTVAATLRAACAFPGREALLGGPIASAPIFRSTDSGATWSRQVDPPLPLVLALREDIERRSWEPPAPPAQIRQQREAPPPPPRQAAGREGRGAGRGAPPVASSRPPPRTATAATMLSFVDPARLLAHYNSGLPLTGASDGVAYAPTQAYWDALVAALTAESEAEGEISLGPGLPDFPQGAAFEVLGSRDGASWTPIDGYPAPAPRGIVAYPESMAAADGQVFLVLAGRNRRGEGWRGGWRLAAP
jgi:hypothetical protein